MQFCAGESVPRALVLALEAAGHDVMWAHETMRGAKDQRVLARCAIEERIIVTFDRAFAEYAVHSDFTGGILLLSVPAPVDAEAAEALVTVINGRDDWQQHYAILEPGRLRLRRMWHSVD
jgi:predicted nuclease of predicted toxin-antitoxin system